MVHPLVYYTDGADYVAEMCNAVLRKYGKAVSVYHFGYTVIYLGIDMVRSACKHDTFLAGIFQHFKNFFAL